MESARSADKVLGQACAPIQFVGGRCRRNDHIDSSVVEFIDQLNETPGGVLPVCVKAGNTAQEQRVTTS